MIKSALRTIKQKIKKKLGYLTHEGEIGNNGERVDLDLSKSPQEWKLDMYQKNHLERYKFSTTLIDTQDECADMACGSGYGTYLISKKCTKVVGFDIDKSVIAKVSQRYIKENKITFQAMDLADLNITNCFDKIVSFETIEHIEEQYIPKVLLKMCDALKPNGKLIFSVPLMQKPSREAIEAGFHKTFEIDLSRINVWLNQTQLRVERTFFQNYDDQKIRNSEKVNDDFIICIAVKNEPT